ncbi:alpha/beta fold hydrolase [Sedimentitalea sp. HM32M-2]|uniref:alpha/beta fold hydrolase n=1 Tax=Sedimentitalea sp. HM32M-2 TaxID=3351566 RepID=UPI00363E2D80
MPHITINATRLHFTDLGEGPETIVFSHGLLFSGRMFDAQVAQLQQKYRCITYDHRGQGGSAVTPDGYDMDTLTEDAAALIRALDAGPCHFVGLSMGGFVGLRLALRHPELLKSLTLLDTSADPEPTENRGRYRLLNFVARWFGLRIVVSRVMPILFGATFLSDPARAPERRKWRDRIVANDRLGITRAVRGVIERSGVTDRLGRIDLPVLILVGDEDVATVPEKSERMQARIPGARLVRLTAAGHSAPIEQPAAVTAEIRAFLRQQSQHAD